MKCLIITYEKYQDHELIFPYYAAQSYGFKVDVCANHLGKIYGSLGTHMPCDLTFNQLGLDDVEKYDLLIIPGGVKALEKLRLEHSAVRFVKEWFKNEKPCFCICNGAQLLITADVLKGRVCSGYYSIEPDIKNAGAVYQRDGVCIDKNLVSCAHYNDMGQWFYEGMNYFKLFYLTNESKN